MDAREVALAPAGRDQPPLRADPERLRREPRLAEQAEQQVEPDAVRADRHEVGRRRPPAERDDGDRLARLDVFLAPRDDHEPVGPAERRDRARPLAQRVGRQPVRAVDEVDEQVLRPADLAVEPRGHPRRDRLAGLGPQPGQRPDDRGDELVEGEDGRGREPRQDRHRRRARPPRGRPACPA